VTLAKQLDAQVARAVLVSGSPPPEGRDLDLLVRPEEEAALSRWLRENWFLHGGPQWVRFRACSVESVDLLGLAGWGLPDVAVERLFADARPIDGLRNLMRPGPGHVLVLLAQRVAGGDGRLTSKESTRLERALAEDGDAWVVAAAEAQHWRAAHAVAALEAAYAARRPLSLAERAAALAEGPYAAGRTRRRAQARAWVAVVGRRGRGRSPSPLITFSGVDGSGKTSQIDALKHVLERLGFNVAEEYVRIEWMTLTGNRTLALVAAPAKFLIALGARSRARKPARASGEEPTSVVDPGRAFRRRSGLVANAWVLLVALAHARVQRRATRRHLKAGRVIVCDRYTLDARVYLRYEYGEARRFRPQTWLLRRLSPTPLRSFYLDVPPETALARKTEQFGLAELEVLTRLYREEHGALGARRLDGERKPDELCAEIAETTWRALRGA
jgi:thymidylate kinase